MSPESEAARRLLEEVDAEVKSAGELLTIKVAAQRAGVAMKTVRRWYNQGRLPGMRSATGRIRIPARALSAFIAAR
jgi:excisionase family DNA binding protein